MKNVMVDIETGSTESNAVILSIGAVEFDELEVIDRFYINVDPESCMKRGLILDGSTFTWWLKQSKEAQKALIKKQTHIKTALEEFAEWLGKKDNLQIWGNGSDFDNVILQNAYKACRLPCPWTYRDNRCFKTLRASYPKLEMERVGTYHNAVDDAEYQANYLIELCAKNKMSRVL